MAGAKKRAAPSKKKAKEESSGSDETSEDDDDLGARTAAAVTAVPADRIKLLNKKDVSAGEYVLLWVQASVRVEFNFALEYAIGRANELDKPVLAFFGITDNYPEANERHYAFMLEGLAEAQRRFAERGVKLVVWRQSPEAGVLELARRAALVVVDRGYVRIQRQWREKVAAGAPCQVVQVEDNVIVPVEVASNKEEYAARTIRPKIMGKLNSYLVPVREAAPARPSTGLAVPDGGRSLDLSDVGAALASLQIDRSVPRVGTYLGGESHANRLLDEFIERKLKLYADKRNEPSLDCVSHMSPYLHFGQISPIHIALQVMRRGTHAAAKKSYIEELVVRRELSMNFCEFNDRYDSYAGLPDWAIKSLAKHAPDRRERIYSRADLEAGRTADPYWNASQREMVITGKMHNYMRMYWGKKILEWMADPKEAFETALYLNNKYELDGRDPNSFAGVAWVFGKHDRPWGPERPVFGLIRYMNAGGLERKLDIKAYVAKVRALEQQQQGQRGQVGASLSSSSPPPAAGGKGPARKKGPGPG